MRASLKGMEDAIADPDAAVAASLELIRAGGNKNFLSEEGESFRWQVEKDLVEQAKGDLPIGVIDPALLQAEVDAYTEAGVFETAPSIDGTYSVDLAAEAYGPDGKVNPAGLVAWLGMRSASLRPSLAAPRRWRFPRTRR